MSTWAIYILKYNNEKKKKEKEKKKKKEKKRKEKKRRKNNFLKICLEIKKKNLFKKWDEKIRIHRLGLRVFKYTSFVYIPQEWSRCLSMLQNLHIVDSQVDVIHCSWKL